MWLTTTDRLEAKAVNAVCRLQNGQCDAIADLFDLYGRVLFMVIARIVRDPEVVDLLVEECLLRAANLSKELHRESQPVGPWLVSIAKKCAVDYVNIRSAREPQMAMTDFGATPDDSRSQRHEVFEMHIVPVVH